MFIKYRNISKRTFLFNLSLTCGKCIILGVYLGYIIKKPKQKS